MDSSRCENWPVARDASAQMFRTVKVGSDATVTIVFAGQPLRVPAGFTVGAALMLAGAVWTRESVEGARRGPHCMMGACHECQVIIDGLPGWRACQVLCREGMRIDRQAGQGGALDEY